MLTGTIPAAAVASLAGLYSFTAASNFLTGTIPGAAFFDTPQLAILDLSNNSLTGPVPLELIALEDLQARRGGRRGGFFDDDDDAHWRECVRARALLHTSKQANALLQLARRPRSTPRQTPPLPRP